MVFARLKQETDSYHTRLEETVDILNRIKTKRQYQDVLKTFYGFYKPLEAQLGEIEDIQMIDFHNRRKVASLQEDLKALGLSEQDIDHLPLCMDLPQLTTLAEACGCLYVVEGATLGGQIITRQIQKLPSPELPHAFFTSYGSQVGKQWKALQDVTERVFGYEQFHPILVRSAQETFIKLERWFQAQNA